MIILNLYLSIMGGGILPVAIHNDKLFFLFGKEVYDGKWSDFGGGKENTESPFQTAVREGCEELNGFFGCRSALERLVRTNMVMEIRQKQYTVYIFRHVYDESLPSYFDNNHAFIRQRLPKMIDKNGLFEKSKVAWFSVKEMRDKKNSFRPFYKEVLEKILLHEKDILKSME